MDREVPTTAKLIRTTLRLAIPAFFRFTEFMIGITILYQWIENVAIKIEPWRGGGAVRFRVGAPEQRDVKRNE